MNGLIIFFYVVFVIASVNGHGRLYHPPGRSTAWRFGFSTPVNYNDNELNCGGFNNQWEGHGGKCGLCGDPYQGPRINEAGGQYATGTIVGRYTSGSQMEVKVQITANHKGWHEFRLCKNDNTSSLITQACLDQHLLTEVSTGKSRLYMDVYENMKYTWTLQLPQGLTCIQCVLQWKWNCGNSWGSDSDGTGIGYGPQEQFYGCADIAISDNSNGGDSHNTGSDVVETATTTAVIQNDEDRATDAPKNDEETTIVVGTPAPTPAPTPGPSSSGCRPTSTYAAVPGMTDWCVTNCALGNCPASHCICGPAQSAARLQCSAVGIWRSVPNMKQWCDTNCNHVPSYCPSSHCNCN